MFIYNVTCNISSSLEEEWVEWMTETHIPEVLETGCFTSCCILKIHTEVEHNTGVNYAVQYTYDNPSNYDLYINNFGPEIQAKTKAKYGDSVLTFRTHLEIIKNF